MFLTDEQTKKINDMLEKMQKNIVSPADLERFIAFLTKTIEKTKGEMSSLSAENIKFIKDSIAFIEENYAKQVNTLKDEKKSMVGDFERNLASFKEVVQKALTQKPIDGIDGVSPAPSEIVPLVLKELKLPEQKDVILDGRKEIVEKINTGDTTDLKIELGQIETGKLRKDVSDWALSVLDQRTQFLINKTVKHDDTLSGSGTDSSPLSVAGFWKNDGSPANAILTVSAIAPSSPSINDLWYDIT